MITIYKYGIDSSKIGEEQEFLLPVGSHILSCGVQGNSLIGTGLFFWAMVNTEETQKESRVLLVYITGEEIACHYENMRFVSTVFVGDGVYMCHVFEIINYKARR